MVQPASAAPPLPLDGITVLDLSRMLPGAILARQLLDLGARLIKVEDPGSGDPIRHTPPMVGEHSAGFAVLLRGAESACLDLRQPADAARLRRLARQVDVVVESFRPGTLEAWGLGWEELHRLNPTLVYCSLSSFGRNRPWAARVGHDLNFVALSGALSLMGTTGVPRLQLADVSTGLLACSAILGALLARTRTGRGCHLDQPLVAGSLPFVTWAWADAAAGPGSVLDTMLAGRCPCYRLYRCGDGLELAVGAIEPKFWTALVDLLGMPELAGAALETGEAGEAAAEAVAAAFATRPRDHWLELGAEHGLPLSAVHGLDDALTEPCFAAAGLLEATPLTGGGTLQAPGPFLPDLGRTPSRPAPALGEHAHAVLAELVGEDDVSHPE